MEFVEFILYGPVNSFFQSCQGVGGSGFEPLLTLCIRVGSHVVSVRIHCTEKWRTSFHTDVLSKSK